MQVNVSKTRTLFLHGNKEPIIESQGWRCADKDANGKPTPLAVEVNEQFSRFDAARRTAVLETLQAVEAACGKLTKRRKEKLMTKLYEMSRAVAVEAWQAGAKAEQILHRHSKRGSKRSKVTSIDETNAMVQGCLDAGMDLVDAFATVANECGLASPAVRGRWYRRHPK